MNVTELRIGNLTDKGIVNAVGYKEGILGCMIIESEIMSFGKWFSYQDLNPIMINKQRLLDLGFRQDRLNEGSFVNSYFRFHSQRPLGTTNKFLLVTEAYYCERALLVSGGLMHVHQLQNLYFALTNKELKRVDGF